MVTCDAMRTAVFVCDGNMNVGFAEAMAKRRLCTYKIIRSWLRAHTRTSDCLSRTQADVSGCVFLAQGVVRCRTFVFTLWHGWP